jgi:hypothetical protein
MMSNTQQPKPDGHSFALDAVVALAIGALLAVLVSVPFDRVLGLSAILCTALKYAASTVVVTFLAGGRPTRLAQAHIPHSDPAVCVGSADSDRGLRVAVLSCFPQHVTHLAGQGF